MKKLTQEEFIRRSIEFHGNEYDYSLVDYKNTYTKVKIKCKKHGIFEQIPSSHVRFGCSFCSQQLNSTKSAGIKKLDTQKFIDKSIKIHGEKYDYLLVNYILTDTKVKIKCKKHGIFEQTPHHHLRGVGCPKCSFNRKLDTQTFIEKAKIIHDNKYNYEISEFVHCKSKIQIICRKHGIFEQKPTDHLNGCGCPICKESKGERQIRNFLKQNNISFEAQYTFEKCRYKEKLPFDFFIPSSNLCIEYDGEQHFKKYYFESDNKRLNIRKLRDKIKNIYCKTNNINLLRIKYNDDVEEVLNSQFLLI